VIFDKFPRGLPLRRSGFFRTGAAVTELTFVLTFFEAPKGPFLKGSVFIWSSLGVLGVFSWGDS